MRQLDVIETRGCWWTCVFHVWLAWTVVALYPAVCFAVEQLGVNLYRPLRDFIVSIRNELHMIYHSHSAA